MTLRCSLCSRWCQVSIDAKNIREAKETAAAMKRKKAHCNVGWFAWEKIDDSATIRNKPVAF